MRIKWFFLVFIMILFIPFRISEASIKERDEYEQLGLAIWDFCQMKGNYVALTFDDGPDPVYTPQILDLLKKYQVKATFFVVGKKAKDFPEVIQRINKEGHEIANHTYNHGYDVLIKEDKLTEELIKTEEVVKAITSKSMTLYRPVAGIYNDTIMNTATKQGYLVTMWSWHQDPKDWMNPGVYPIFHHVSTAMKPGDIIVLHDAGGDRSQTVFALEEILKTMKNIEFKGVTVSELILLSQEIPTTIFDAK
ncbi:polysaccharide deacetylase family protein [Cytobacillus sp. FSL R5-0569]|nr:polysaccharide deacetylase family protein [Cytobacillus sp. OWB-43]MEA1853216.1 polysaccharide deacetylase family protein [Cytobacillus sp. OWB-43]